MYPNVFPSCLKVEPLWALVVVVVLLEASLYSLPSLWENVYSTGIEAHGVNPNAIKAMKEVNIDITKQTSDIIDPNILM